MHSCILIHLPERNDCSQYGFLMYVPAEHERAQSAYYNASNETFRIQVGFLKEQAPQCRL